MFTTNRHDDGTICTCEAIEVTQARDDSHDQHHHHVHGKAHNHEHDHAPSSAAATAEFGVAGMTCSHCVASVTNELGQLDGVTNVDIDLVAGGVSRITVASESALPTDQVAAAITEAGYELVELPR
jgi:copper chaperone